MPSFGRAVTRGLSEAVGEIAKGLSKAVPEAAERGTAESPVILERALARQAAREAAGLPPRGVRYEGEGVPFAGRPEDRARFRAVPAPGEAKSLSDHIDDVKVAVGNVARHEPGLPKDLSSGFGELRALSHRIKQQVEVDLADNVFGPLRDLPVEEARKRARLVSDYMKGASEAAELAVNTDLVNTPEGVTRFTAEQNLKNIASELDEPSKQVHENIRKRFDDLFELSNKRGWIDERSYKEAYTPMKKLLIGLNGILKARGEDAIASEVLGQFLMRGKGIPEHANTNVATLLLNYETLVRRRVAEEEFLVRILNDKTLNFTDRFQPGDVLPPELAWYTPKPGKMGYIQKSDTQKALDGVLDGMNIPSDRDRGRSFALPKHVVAALEKYHAQTPSGGESMLYNKARGFARQFTVYNPGTTFVNLVSDTPLALMGMEGERAQPIGFLRQLPGAVKTAVEGVYSGGRKGGEKYRRALTEGIATSTYAHDIGGAPHSELLGHLGDAPPAFNPTAPGDYVASLKEHLKKARQTIELFPKIAAAEEALARTGKLSEYGRIGRNITGDYTKSAAINRHPVGAALAPVYAFISTVTPRILNMARMKGSKGRTLAAIAAVPVAIDMWNNHDPEFAKVEDSLHEWERNQLHFIEAGEDGRPKIDETGKPVVKRIQYFVPEQVANQFGLGNAAGRLRRVVQGKDTASEAVGSVGKQFLRSNIGQLLPARVVMELGYGRSLTSGKEQEGLDALLGLAPAAKMASEIAKAQGNVGTTGQGGALERSLEVLTGAGEASVSRKGPGILNATLRDAQADQAKAQQAMKKAFQIDDFVEAEKQRKKMMAAIERVQRAGKITSETAESVDKFQTARAMDKAREMYPEFAGIKDEDEFLQKVIDSEPDYAGETVKSLRMKIMAKFGE